MATHKVHTIGVILPNNPEGRRIFPKVDGQMSAEDLWQEFKIDKKRLRHRWNKMQCPNDQAHVVIQRDDDEDKGANPGAQAHVETTFVDRHKAARQEAQQQGQNQPDGMIMLPACMNTISQIAANRTL